MRDRIICLDSSAILKRCIEEPGSSRVREAYLRGYSRDVALSYSVWNIGEVLCAFDGARRSDRIDDGTYGIARRRFLLEVRRMVRTGLALVVLLRMGILGGGSWQKGTTSTWQTLYR